MDDGCTRAPTKRVPWRLRFQGTFLLPLSLVEARTESIFSALGVTRSDRRFRDAVIFDQPIDLALHSRRL
jgi:hypothetical protein